MFGVDILALIPFAFAQSATPGPNNLMLLASGANFGVWRTVPHILGVAGGFIVMALVLGLGLSQIFTAYPITLTIMKVFAVLYMLWLAWRIANASAPQAGAGAGKPLTMLQAALIQWLNPKAMAMGVNAVTLFAVGGSTASVVTTVFVFGAVNLCSISLWAIAGQKLRAFLSDPLRLKLFNWTMAGLLVVSLYPILTFGG